MKRWIGLLIFLSVLGWSGGWNSNMDSARFFAKKRHQMLMVFVENKHCKWCKKMKTRTFTNPHILSKYQAITRLKVNGENREVLAHLPRVNAVPVVFFMDPYDKKVLKKVSGYRDANSFLASILSAQKIFDEKYKKVKK
jgi:thioredoxin-related protein